MPEAPSDGDIAVTGGSVNRRRAEALAEHGSDLPLIVDADAVIRYVGPTVTPILGYHANDVLHTSGWDFYHPDDVPAVRRQWDEVIAEPAASRVWEARVRRADGEWTWIEVRATNYLQDPAINGVVGNIRDVSDKHKAREAIAELDDFYRAILGAAQEGVWVVDPSGRTLYANDAMAVLLGVLLADLRSGTIWDFVDEATAAMLRRSLQARMEGTSSRYELEFVRRDGQRRVVSVSATPLPDKKGVIRAAVGLWMDITERHEHENELRTMALRDSVTGLPNPTLFADRLAQAKSRHERTGGSVSILLLDLDRFHVVNDTLGRDAGDELLRRVAERLSAACRDDDTLARLGGDEFAVVCPEADTYVGQRIAEALLAAFDEPFDHEERQIALGVSIGVASADKAPPDDLLRAANTALQRAKAHGRGRIETFDPVSRRVQHDQLRMFTELRQAMRADQLDLHYQPIVGPNGGIGSVEALLRWSHPELGTISPAHAVRVAEDNGLMAQLGEWILHRACRDIGRQLDASAAVGVGVNLSARQLVDDSIVPVVESALRQARLPADRLTLEVTETSLLIDPETIIPRLRRLKQLGVSIALDDFGTGYSSLTYLRDFPVDTIKIDRSFIAGVTSNHSDLAIVTTLASLAVTVDMTVVAEGVETVEQAEILRRLGISHLQGFLWSTAVPLEELRLLLRRGPFPPLSRQAVRGTRPLTGRPSLATDADRQRILALHRSGHSPASIAAALNADGRTTSRGTRWHRNTVARVIADTIETRSVST